MRVRVDQDACAGSGQCVMSAPAVFDQRETDGVVTLLDDGPDPRLHGGVRTAARLCPARAIALSAR
ncbi:ferredoxin [Murinocardiopsis flavida]|uniref:Ferredoxin n=1 Tax=Murinocardiopsis flavida TaxID=645275 RepID=A0A2P8DKD1_9ACTN|nr:ferredoxin [Murinocardiopsis flavida]PSK97687.1 ferredoxin [Murinocardiopsis flavida]